MTLIRSITDLLQALLTAVNVFTGNMGLAIILLTVLIRVILHPLSRVSLKSMKKMQALAPQMEVLRRKYKDDSKQANIEIMGLMRSAGVNPLGGCLPMLIQFPVLIALYNLFRPERGLLEGQSFLGISLALIPSVAKIAENPVLLVFPVLVGATTYLQQRLSMTDPQQAKLFIFMPFFTAYWAILLPVGMSLYWIVSTMVGIVEYFVVVGRPVRPAPALARSPTPPRARSSQGAGEGTPRKAGTRRHGGSDGGSNG